MGPTPFSVGDLQLPPVSFAHVRTSMGPTPFSVGDVHCETVHHLSSSHFNGANAIQRWRRKEKVEFCANLVASSHFNGANAIQRWRQALRAQRDAGESDFNGANAIQRWRPDGAPPDIERRDIHFNGANAIQRWRQIRAARITVGGRHFNGANAIQRWRRASRRPGRRRTTALQWGQRHSALETNDLRRALKERGILQWGQRHSALETTKAAAALRQESDFNGANAIQRWRLIIENDLIPGWPRLQWGQRHSALETDMIIKNVYASIGTSMGPTPFSVGDAADGVDLTDAANTSMGPTPFSVGDDQ